MVLIFFFSSQNGEQSSNLSEGVSAFLGDILRKIFPEDTVIFLLSYVRKAAHVFLYACLGTFVTLFFSTFSFSHKTFYFLLPIGVCFLYACLDELHQVFVSGRTGALTDILIDGIGFVSVNLFFNLCFLLTDKQGEK